MMDLMAVTMEAMEKGMPDISRKVSTPTTTTARHTKHFVQLPSAELSSLSALQETLLKSIRIIASLRNASGAGRARTCTSRSGFSLRELVVKKKAYGRAG
jgi:hypothetical protein